jgi:hypothetical protein
MSDRIVDLDPKCQCDSCGKSPAYDFYGDFICGECMAVAFPAPLVCPSCGAVVRKRKQGCVDPWHNSYQPRSANVSA